MVKQCPCEEFASRRLARSHCEKRGESGVDGASARSGCAKSAVFCARSASDGDDTRGFSPCLTFWYFWVKPKVQRRNSCRLQSARGSGAWRRAGRSLRQRRPAILSYTPQASIRISCKIFLCSFFRRKSQRRSRGENDREAVAHLAERSQKTALFCTIVPGARCAAASSSDIFTSRDHAGLRPAKERTTLRAAHRSIRNAPQAETDRTAVRTPGAGVRTTAAGECRDRFAGYAEPPQSKRRER